MGKNRPQRKIIGKRKKLEKVCASKTSLTETAMKSPRKVDEIAIITMAGITADHNTVERSVKKIAIMIGTQALTAPKRIAPLVLANIRSSSEMGESSSLSKERFFFSKVTVTASMEVVPNRMEIAITPGSIAGMLSEPLPDLIKNIDVQATGNINPQLMLGGLR